MFKIMVDGNLLYHPLLVDDGYAIISATIDLELDKTGSATITIPVTNPMYNNISKMLSMVEIYDDDEQIFRGRVLHDDRDFDNNKELYCEGDLAFMIDNVFPPYSFVNKSVAYAFGEYVRVYNEQVEPQKRFIVGDVTVTGTVNITNYDFTMIWDELNAQLVDTFGGHVRTRYNPSDGNHYIDYLTDYNHVCEQPIKFGVNMLDFSEYISAEDVFTVLIPLGAKQENASGEYIGRVNITGIQTDHHEYVNNRAAQDIFGNIWKIQIWDDITDPYELRALGEDLLSKNLKAATTIGITAVDLSLAGLNVPSIRIGDGVRVISNPHGIDDIFQCVKISYDLLQPSNCKYDFGQPEKSISQNQVDSTNSSSSAIASSDARTDQMLAQAISHTDLEILKTTNSYESDRTVILDETNLNYNFLDIIDNVTPKQYRTVNGESRLKFGIVAEDLLNAMEDAGINDIPIVTNLGSGKYTVSYDEIVALLWKKVQDLQQQIDDMNGG